MSDYRGKHQASTDDTAWFDDSFSTEIEHRFSRQRSRSDERRQRNADQFGLSSSGRSGRSKRSKRSSSGRFGRSVVRSTFNDEFFDENAGSGYGKGRGQERERAYVGYTVDDAKNRRGPIYVVIMTIVALAAVGALVFGGFKLAESFGLIGSAAVGGDGTEVSIFIPEGSTTAEIAAILKRADVIAKESSFINTVLDRGAESKLQSGTYMMRTGMTDVEAIDVLLAGPTSTGEGDKLTIPEGLTLVATAARVEEACGIPASEFIAEASSADKYVADYPFLEGVYNNSMEGYLYPKTYMIPKGSNAEYVVRVLLDQFVIETAELDLNFAMNSGLNLRDVVTIASMIEKETAAPQERPLVSSVIYNRLRDEMYLQICATVVYAIGLENYDGHPLLESDLTIDSPHNTYQSGGLPAGPICSPRIESIEAAAHPSETNYYYYVLTSEEGTHTFCTTYEEFEAANVIYRELFDVAQ